VEGLPPPDGRQPQTDLVAQAVCLDSAFVYWAIALVLIALVSLDRTTTPAPAQSDEVAFIAWFAWLVVAVILIAIAGLLSTLRQWEQLGAAATTSRCLVVFTCLLGFVAIVLFEARRWGVHIEACHTVGELGDLPGGKHHAAGAWHAGLARGQRGTSPRYHSLAGIGIARHARLMPSSGRASSLSACGSR